MRRPIAIFCALAFTLPALGEGVMQLQADGDLGVTPQVYNLPDGTRLEWAEIYESDASQVAIGRSRLDGPRMAAEDLAYTDCFYVARGTSTVIVNGKSEKVSAGDFILLPRGTHMEGRNFRNYVHFAASFETGPGAKSNGLKELRRLRPDTLHDADFTVEGDNMRHVYYEGAGGVIVRAWQSTKPDLATEFFTSPWSELSFVVAGTTTITQENGSVLSLKKGDTFFIAKGQRVKVTAHRLKKLAIVFDQKDSSP